MTAETAPGQAGAVPGQAGAARGPAEPGAAGNGQPPGFSDRMVRYGIWFAVAARCLGDRRVQASIVTGAIGTYALASVFKNNQARPMRRMVRWYNTRSRLHNAQTPHGAPRPAQP
jgi:hypothetical protein